MPVVQYEGWPNCVNLENESIDLVVTTDVGPRIVRFAFKGGTNLLKQFPDQMGQTGGDDWRIYGGHRFWHAPEHPVRTYYPDNTPVDFVEEQLSVKLTQKTEPTTGMRKELVISLDAKVDRVTLTHRLVNENLWEVEAACWALTVMAPGGRAIIPHEPYRSHTEYMLPARPLVLWHYSDMSDPRFTWGKKYIQVRQDPAASTKNKVGLLNKQGWAAYCLEGNVFLKCYPCIDGAPHVDYGCNTECYVDPDMIEVESLGPLTAIPSGGSIEHTEEWWLFAAEIGPDDPAIDDALMPLVEKTRDN